MKHLKIIIGTLLLLLLPLLAGIGIARAQDIRSGNNVTISADQTINSTLWSAGKNVDIAGTINGDVFCFGQSVNVSATVNGDVICAGQDVHISGPVHGDVRVAGQQVSLSSKVDGNISVASQSFTLDQTGNVGRDASAAGSDLTINGTVGRDLVAAGQTITIGSTIGRNVKATDSNLKLTSSAKIGGNLNYTSTKTADIAQGATVAGTTHRSEPQKQQRHVAGVGFRIAFGLYWLISLLIVALVFALLLPGVLASVAAVALERPWKTLLTGLVAGLLFPILFIALLLTVVGIPLALLLLGLWLLVLTFGGLFFGYYVGRLILRGRANVVWITLLGSLIVLVLMQVPILGFLVTLVTWWMGVGMVLLSLSRRFVRPKYALPAR